MEKNYKEKLAKIKCFIFDIDGVLTDGTVHLIAGEQVRNMFIKDGYALQLAVKKGYKVAIISGGSGTGVKDRLTGLGVPEGHIALRVGDKMEKFEEFLLGFDLTPEEIVYVGDDIPDLTVIKAAGVSVSPSDAAREVKESASYASPYAGGRGCVRDIIEQTMRVQGKWMSKSEDALW